MDNGEGGHPMDFLLTEDLNLPSAGDIREGWVVEKRNNVLLVDIGAKSEGIITPREIDSLDDDTLEVLSVGNLVKVCVIDPEDQNGNMIVSYTQAAKEEDWKTVAGYLETKEVCRAKIIGFNRGGLLVKIGELRGFVPNSQLRRERQLRGNSENELQAQIGQPIDTKVIEVDRDRNRLIMSERAAEEEIRRAKRLEIMAELQVGDEREGRVVNLADFGAFVDIGGLEGLVHVSELSWKRVNNPSEVLELGQTVNVAVIKIDEERQRLALSIKRLQPDPWSFLEEQYQVGQLVEGTITRLTKFGAFARLSDEFELVGLIHISEMSDEHVAHPRDVVQPNEQVMVRVIRIDPEQRQLGLSLKQVTSDKFMASDLEMLAAS
jgi:small subunit ribosomal protein S1